MPKKSVSDHWDDIFFEYSILDHVQSDGFFKISADQIKKHKEPRLMTKFDHSKNRPKIFKDHNLSILPIDNGEYIIGPFELYKSLDDKTVKPKVMQLPDFYETIDIENIYSETNALNVAEISGMITDLAKEDVKQTIAGRMRANQFGFKVNTKEKPFEINVGKPQIEIDGGYESSNKIIVIEAKNSEPDDFIIRQLYYPYRYWKMKVNKEIIPVFFTYKNGIYTFYIYEFEELENYNSIRLKEKLSYTIKFNQNNYLSIDSVKPYKESSLIPFPQADAFNRVIDLILTLYKSPRNNTEITKLFNFTTRQTNYYVAAANYLGFIQDSYPYSLSSLGHDLASLNIVERNKKLILAILSHQVFSEAYNLYLKNMEIPKSRVLAELLVAQTNIKLNATAYRRASTIRGWLTWIINSGIEIN